MIDARRIKEKVDDLEYKLCHASLRQAELDGVIAPKDQDLVDISENTVSVGEPQEDQGKHEEVFVMSPKHFTNIYSAVTS